MYVMDGSYLLSHAIRKESMGVRICGDGFRVHIGRSGRIALIVVAGSALITAISPRRFIETIVYKELRILSVSDDKL